MLVLTILGSMLLGIVGATAAALNGASLLLVFAAYSFGGSAFLLLTLGAAQFVMSKEGLASTVHYKDDVEYSEG